MEAEIRQALDSFLVRVITEAWFKLRDFVRANPAVERSVHIDFPLGPLGEGLPLTASLYFEKGPGVVVQTVPTIEQIDGLYEGLFRDRSDELVRVGQPFVDRLHEHFKSLGKRRVVVSLRGGESA